MRLRLFFLVPLFWLTLPNGHAGADSLLPAQVQGLAERGDAAAQYELGLMYKGGRGVTQDSRKAAEWYRRSAEQGYAPAERSLGAMYRGGYGGLPQDDAQAKLWYRKAAVQGDTLAKFALVLEDSPFIAFVRTLPQGYREAIFFAVLALVIILPVAACIFVVIFAARFLKRMAGRSS